MFHLHNPDIEPFTLYAALPGKQGVLRKDMLPDTHRLQQAYPYPLTAGDGLVAVDAGTDGIPHTPGFRFPDCRMEPPRL